MRWLDMELHVKAADHARIARAFRDKDPGVGQMLSDHVLNYVEAALKSHKSIH